MTILQRSDVSVDMEMPDGLEQRLDELVVSCMKCGFCKAVCPLFAGVETTAPRAKVRLARAVLRGELTTTPGVRAQMERCLSCRACAEECPSGVEPQKIALAMRAAYVDKYGLSSFKRMIFRVGLPRPRLLAWALKGLGLVEQVSAIELPNNPLRYLLPLFGLRRDRDLPVMGRRTLMSRLPEQMKPLGETKLRVLYFPGCAINFIYPEIGLATVNVLRKLGAEVLLPHNLVCCSTPVFSSGDLEGARELARTNARIILSANADIVVTSCGSCGLTLKREWLEVLGVQEAEKISSRVQDITEFVVRYADDSALTELEWMPLTTYHDSCHLRRGMRVYEEPRQLLGAILGGRFVEMTQADRCCGGGGTFSWSHPELSQQVAEIKVQSIANSGASVVLTGCPACVMQLRDSFVHRGMKHRVAHTVEIIDQALQPGG